MPGLPSLLLVVPLLLSGYSSGFAQGRPTPVKRATWLTLGLGLGPQFGTEVATAAVGGISHQARSLILSLSGASAVSGGTSVQSIGILAGAGTPPKARHVSLEIGLARVSGNHTSAAVIGVPVQGFRWDCARA